MAGMTAFSITAFLRNSLSSESDFKKKDGIGGKLRSADVVFNFSAWRENVILKSSNHECRSKLLDKRKNDVGFSKQILEHIEEESIPELPEEREKLSEMIEEVKTMLSSMSDGEITSSAYDTAWVAMVPDLRSSDRPEFPSCLQWIIDNQLEDGSWGDHGLFSAHDRIISTLACSVALRSWSVCLPQCQRGLLFLKENMWRLEEEDEELMPIGFEVALPSLIAIAKGFSLDFPYDHSALEGIYAKKEIKLKRIPRELMHKMPTTLLHSLEGMPGLEWSKLLKLQCLEGSFLFSPSSTAFALMQTGDENCHGYLKKVVDKFHGGVPNVYPVDIFEHLWVVDRLQRLGISRFFNGEIKLCMEYVFKYWNDNGICWARNSEVRDIDDTAMGFRLLRLHGYNVSPDVFSNFRRNGEFFSFIGQSNQAVTGMYNLNRASQLIFSGEEILDQAKAFSSEFLRKKQTSNQLLDKWVISKDLSGEVAYALDFPFYASLPRIEARWYLDQYGGGDDVWIGKTLYRMLYVNNAVYLDLAKADFNQCQAMHQVEWLGLQRWHHKHKLNEYGMSKEHVQKAFFLASASIFEANCSTLRLCWAQTAALAEALSSSFDSISIKTSPPSFTLNKPNGLHQKRSEWKLIAPIPVNCILELLDFPKLPAKVFDRRLRQAWERWLQKLPEVECMEGETAMLLVRSIELCAGRTEPDREIARIEYGNLTRLAISICERLQAIARVSQESNVRIGMDSGIKMEMEELVKCVLEHSKNPNALSNDTKQTFLIVVKSFFYSAWCPANALQNHISKVLFEKVE